MAKPRSVRRRAALLRAGFSPEHSVPQVPLEPVVELVLEPTEPYVEVPRDTPPSPDALEVISDVSISPTTTPTVSLFSSSAFSTPKVSPVMQTFDEDLSENVKLSPTYVPAASTSWPKEYQLGDAPVSPKPVELVFGASLSGSFDDGAQVEEEAGTVRHPKYSFPDGSLNCQVENTLFSIHQHIRELSPAMADLLPVDRPLTMDRTYFTRIHPSPRIKLHDVKAAEFEALLDMIYTPAYAVKSLNQATYASALPLCIKWGLTDLRTFILCELEKTMSDVELFCVAREQGLSDLVESCTKSLVTRSERLTVEEGLKLGVEPTIFISGLREEARTRNQCLHRCIACDAKPHVNGQNMDLGFVERRVQVWVDSNKQLL